MSEPNEEGSENRSEPLAGQPSPEDYRLIVERSWQDIHHSRNQDWKSLILVAGVHFAAVELIEKAGLFMGKSLAGPVVGVGLAIFSVVGLLVVCRHCRLMRVELGWIYCAEKHLGLIMKTSCDQKRKCNPNEPGVIPLDEKMEFVRPWRKKRKWRWVTKISGGLRHPRPGSAGFLMACFYYLLIFLDLGVAVGLYNSGATDPTPAG